MPASEAARPVNLQTPRVVKCPTPQCPGWITLDSTRHQTEPCRYCRVGVDTLRFLLSRVGAEHKALPHEVHDEFNRLMLTMAGAWGRNVYLQPSPKTLVDLLPGARGVTVEYNPLLGAAGADGAGPLVGTILHKLLHFEAHIGQRVPQITTKSGSKDRESMLPLVTYLLTVTDHAWVSGRMEQLYPSLYAAQARWGLDVSHMLAGSESMFNRYLSERNLNKLLDVLAHSGDNADSFRAAVLERLAGLTSQILEREKEEQRRVFIAIQLANIRLLNPSSYAAYQEALGATRIENLREAVPLAERLYSELHDAANAPAKMTEVPGAQQAIVVDGGRYVGAIQAGVKALGLANYFEVKG